METNNIEETNNELLESIKGLSPNWPNINKKEWDEIKKDRELILSKLSADKKEMFLNFEKFLDEFFSKKDEIFKISKEDSNSIKWLFSENPEIENKVSIRISTYESENISETITALRNFAFSDQESEKIIPILETMYKEKMANLRLLRFIAESEWVSKDYILTKLGELNKTNELDLNAVNSIWAYLKLWPFAEQDKEIINDFPNYKKTKINILWSFCENVDWAKKDDIPELLLNIWEVDDNNLTILRLYLDSWKYNSTDTNAIIGHISKLKINESEETFIQKFGFIYEYIKYVGTDYEALDLILSIKWDQFRINDISWIFIDYCKKWESVKNWKPLEYIKYLITKSPEELEELTDL